MTINEQINAVVDAREHYERISNLKKNSLINWEQNNSELLAELSLCVQVKGNLEASLREMAIESYAKTKDKAMAPGVGIRVLTKLDYDNKVALKWATEHNLALKLDTSAFEKIAKTNPIDFVTTFEVLQATIATELAKVEEDRQCK